MKDKVDAIIAQLPDDANLPIAVKHDIGAIPIMELMVTADRPLRELYELVVREIRSHYHGFKASPVLISSAEKNERYR